MSSTLLFEKAKNKKGSGIAHLILPTTGFETTFGQSRDMRTTTMLAVFTCLQQTNKFVNYFFLCSSEDEGSPVETFQCSELKNLTKNIFL